MNTRLFVCSGKLLALTLLIGLSSCNDPKKAAQKSLARTQYEFTTDGFLTASAAGDYESVALFQEAGMEVDAENAGKDTALIQASANGRKQVVEQLLGFGADPQKVNSAGRNALISASAKGFEDVSRLLISRGADLDAKDNEGWSALSIASYNGHSNMVEILAGQADEDTLNESLLLASFNGDVGVIEYLLGQGAYINVRSPDGQTPLMISSEQGKPDAVRVLLQNQANPYSLDNDGATAAKLAVASGHESVSDLILDQNLWGASETGDEIKEEMNTARLALAAGGVDEILDGNVVEEDSGNKLEDYKDERGSAAKFEIPVPEKSHKNQGRTATQAELLAQQSSEIPSGKRTDRKSIKEEATKQLKAKPMVALNGSRIITRSPGQAAIGSMVLAGFREQPLPIALNDVNDGQAGIRKLGSKSDGSVRVKEGRMIPGTDFRLNSVAKKFVSSKEGKGRMVDASRATVENTKTGSKYLLVKDVDGYSSDKYAILTSPGSDYRYVVKTGDVFQSVQPGVGKRDYQVLDIRPDSVVIKDLTTEKVDTITRNGLVGK